MFLRHIDKTGGGDGPWSLVIIIGRGFENKALIMFECHFLPYPSLIQSKDSFQKIKRIGKWLKTSGAIPMPANAIRQEAEMAHGV